MKTLDVVRVLESKGYYLVRSNKHSIYSNGSNSIAVPFSREISIGTLRDIFKVLYPTAQEANKAMRVFRNK